MIKNVDFSEFGLGQNPNEYDYMYILKKKIDEIVDHLNTAHGEGRHHVSPSMEPEFKVWIGAKPHPED